MLPERQALSMRPEKDFQVEVKTGTPMFLMAVPFKLVAWGRVPIRMIS
jgi:hypothetical protein